MTDPAKWKIDPKQVRNPDPRDFKQAKRIDGKPIGSLDELFGPKKKPRT